MEVLIGIVAIGALTNMVFLIVLLFKVAALDDAIRDVRHNACRRRD